MAVYKYTCPFVKRDGTPCNKRCIQPLCCVHLKSVNASKYVDFVSDDEEESAPEVAPVPKKPIAKKRVPVPVDDISDKMQAVAIRPKKQPPVPKPKQPVQYVTAGGQPVCLAVPAAVYTHGAPAVHYVQQQLILYVTANGQPMQCVLEQPQYLEYVQLPLR